MKNLLYILFILFTSACKESGSAKTMAPKSFKYSAFYWGQDYEAKKNVFLFIYHIDIEKNGAYVLMRNDFDYGFGKAIYHKGFINDSILNLIDSVFLDTSYKTDYSIDTDNPIMYHGLTYCFDFSIDSKRNKEIQFIPYYSPKPIKRLGAILDSIILKITASNIDTLYLESYKQKLIKISFPNLPPLPEPPPEPDKNIKPFDPNNYK